MSIYKINNFLVDSQAMSRESIVIVDSQAMSRESIVMATVCFRDAKAQHMCDNTVKDDRTGRCFQSLEGWLRFMGWGCSESVTAPTLTLSTDVCVECTLDGATADKEYETVPGQTLSTYGCVYCACSDKECHTLFDDSSIGEKAMHARSCNCADCLHTKAQAHTYSRSETRVLASASSAYWHLQASRHTYSQMPTEDDRLCLECDKSCLC